MDAIKIISQDLFDKIRSRFSNLEMGDDAGGVTIDPSNAYYFDFDFVVEGSNLGRVSISLGNLGSLKVYYSQGITENQDDPVKKQWYSFLREMRFFAMRRKLRFDTRDITKTNLDKNDFQHLAATQGPKEEPEMTTMNESRWSEKSSRKTSRAVQGKTEVIVRHAQPVDETYAGSRSQRKNIKAIFIQNSDGERFKYPFIHPAGAFAMAQHVDHGGTPHDPAGKAIIDMSEQIAKLGEFHRKVNSATLHPDATGITERAMAHLSELKNRVGMLSKRHHYQQWMSEFQEPQDAAVTELDAVTMEDYKSKFTQTSFQEELSGYFPLLHRIMGEANTVDLEEFVKESNEETDEGILGALGGGAIGAVAAGPLGALTGAAAGDSLTDPDNDEVEKEDTNKLGIGQQMARDGIKYSPDKESELIDLMVQYMKKNGMNSKEIRYRLNYDEDYIPDQLSDLPKEGSSEEPPFEPDTTSNFNKPNNPNRTGMDSARALAQRGMSPAESINAFEEWATATESGEITDDQIGKLADAVAKLPTGDSGKPELKLGQDGSEASMFFSEYGLDSMDLQTKLKDAASGDENADPFQVLKSWAEDDHNYPGLMQRIGMTDAEPAPEPEADPAAPAPEPEADPTAPPAQGEEGADEEPEQPQGTMFEEIAKLVSGRFNRDNMQVGAFNGKENIALEVKKEISEKFGEQAGEMSEQLALQFMEKLSKERDHGPVGDDGLARIREIMRHMGAKVEAIGDVTTNGHAPGNNIMTSAEEGILSKAREIGKKVLDRVAPGDDELLRQLQKSAGVPSHAQHGKPPMASPNRRQQQQESAEFADILKLSGLAK
jgi:hypothetical protein